MKKTRFATILLLALLTILPLNAQKRKGQTGKEPLFGKELATYTVVSESLRGASFYLVAGHGGPDPGAIGIYQGRPLHEDEYAYDIILRLARELMMRGAKVEIIIRLAKKIFKSRQQFQPGEFIYPGSSTMRDPPCRRVP